jgi:hypothetical protein
MGVKMLSSDDIYFELAGRRIAGVESYKTRFSNDVKIHDAFGQNTPVGFTQGSKKHTIDISRAYLEDTAINDGISFYSLSENSDWNLVIVKGGKRTVYSQCIVSEIGESGQLKDRVLEDVSLMALDRYEE